MRDGAQITKSTCALILGNILKRIVRNMQPKIDLELRAFAAQKGERQKTILTEL